MRQLHLSGAALTLSVLLAACGGGGGDTGTGTTPTPTAYAVNGNLSTLNSSATTTAQFFGAWTGGAGTLRATAITDNAALASGAVASGGAFSLTLPASIAESSLETLGEANVDLSDENCSGSLTVSNTGARGTGVGFAVDSASSDGPVTPVDLSVTYVNGLPDTIVATGGGLLYANAATTISGQQTCVVDGTPVTTSINLPLQPGYTPFKLVLTATATRGSLTITAGALPPYWVVSSGSALPLGLEGANKANRVKTLLEGQANSLLPLGLRF